MNTNWYDEVSSIRSEATHYLSGLVDSFDFEELIYDNVPKGERKGAPKDISIKNIEKHIRRIHDNVWTFLSLFGNHFIKIINQDTRVSFTCSLPTTPPEPIGSKIISFREYLNGESGICQTPSLECPMKDSCDAYKKSKSGNMK
jgi:hypothetical protein